MHAQKERNVYNFSLKLYIYVSKGTMPSQNWAKFRNKKHVDIVLPDTQYLCSYVHHDKRECLNEKNVDIV